MKNTSNQLSKRLRYLRYINNYNQTKVIEKTSLSITKYRRFEKGISYPNQPELRELAKLYRVSTDYLIGADETKHNQEHLNLSDKYL